LWATPYKNIRLGTGQPSGPQKPSIFNPGDPCPADESIRFAVRRAAVVLKAFGLDFIGELANHAQHLVKQTAF
jgi:hypothetical protein